MTRRYELSENEAAELHALVSDQIQSLKNWIVTNVENEKYETAVEQVREIRKLQRLYAKLNVKVHRELDAG